MGTYEWTNALVANPYTLGNPPSWWTIGGSPIQAISTESPGGPGDILVRAELFVAASATVVNEPLGVSPFQMYAISLLMLGEVYEVGVGGFPNPSAAGVNSGVISAAAPVTAVSDKDPAHSVKGVTWSTGGYVTSKGRRGPAKYGPGHPELRIGLWATNVFDGTIIGETDSSETYALRALWYVP